MSVETIPTIEKSWKPNSGKQELYLSLPDTIFEQFYGGSAGGGKSEALLMRPILRQWTDNNRFQALILRRTYKELEESLIERSKRGGLHKDGSEIPSFYDFGANYNEQKKKWRFPSGATITFGHAEEEEDVRKYDTAEFQYVAFDELTSFTEFQYKFIAFSRCRSVIPSIPALACSASNPGNIGHRWVRERFVEPAPNGSKIIAERLGGQLIKRIFIQAFLKDNPKLMENDPLYIVRLEMLPEADKRAKLYGDWWTFSGQVFSEWRVEPFIDEPPNARHIISPMIPDSRLPRVLSVDWGKRMMTHGIWGVPLPDKRTIIYKEYPPLDKEGKPIVGEEVKVWTTNMANECMLEGINPYITLDPSAWQARGVKTISEQFIETWREVTGRSPRIEKADNDRIGGKMLVHDYLRWKPRPRYVREISDIYDAELANWIFRNKGLEAHKAYLSQFLPQDQLVPEAIPRLQITSNCKILTKTIPLCVYDEKKGDEDVKEFDGDDPYDNLRYYLKKIDTMKVEELENIPDPSQSSERSERDWNILYRKMEILESQRKKSTFIPLGHRRLRR